MPENIFKIYPPKKEPSENGRRGSGLWYGDSPEVRFNRVRKILDIYYSDDCLFDDLDLTWFLKNAVIGNIYFSKTVVEGIDNKKYWPDTKSETIKNVIDKIIKGQTYKDGAFDESLLQIRKWLGKEYHEKGADPLRFEHVIPAKVYLSKLKELYEDTDYFTTSNSLERFNKFREQIAVCVITKDEDNRLNIFRDSMPDCWEWGDNIFARYEKIEDKIEIARKDNLLTTTPL